MVEVIFIAIFMTFWAMLFSYSVKLMFFDDNRMDARKLTKDCVPCGPVETSIKNHFC
jgi:hypothetical protein